MRFLKGLFFFVVIVVLLAVLGRIFLFELVQTNSYSMVPTLVAGDLFAVKTVGKLGLGDVAVCDNPEDAGNMVVLRVVGLPGQSVGGWRNHVKLDGEVVQHDMTDPIFYEDTTSGEVLKYAVRVGWEYVGGQQYSVALMDKGDRKDFREVVVPDGHFFLMGDNRNMARDSRHFGTVPIDSCLGAAVFLLWPGEDSGDLLFSRRVFGWID
jgi:signal peptidase I